MGGGSAAFPLVAALAACAVLNLTIGRTVPPVGGRTLGMKIEAEGAVETAALFSLGMRRLAADLALIRMIIYYGSPEDKPAYRDHMAPGGGSGHEGHNGQGDKDDNVHPYDRGDRWEGGDYPRMAVMAMRLLDLDPQFTYGALFGAGALAFNLNRTDEALEVLQYALARDPKNTQYQAYAAAIGFHRRGDPKNVIPILAPFLKDPDCPTMIKSMMAYLYRRADRPKDAIRVYLDIYENSRDESYRRTALKNLRELGG